MAEVLQRTVSECQVKAQWIRVVSSTRLLPNPTIWGKQDQVRQHACLRHLEHRGIASSSWDCCLPPARNYALNNGKVWIEPFCSMPVCVPINKPTYYYLLLKHWEKRLCFSAFVIPPAWSRPDTPAVKISEDRSHRKLQGQNHLSVRFLGLFLILGC